MSKVSIVLPVYNGERYLAQAIESILKQTYTNFELLIVNDCSNDRTPEIIDYYGRLDTRVKVINNEQNMKLPRSLNHGFEMASGQYFTWTSDDNLFLPEALRVMVNALENNSDVGMAYCDYTLIDEQGNVIQKNSLDEPELLVGENCIGACFLYRADIARKIGGYDADLFLAEDYDYWLRIYREAKVTHVKENVYLYRMHNQSLTSTRQQDIKRQTYRVIMKHFDLILSRIDKINVTKRNFYFDCFCDFAPEEKKQEMVNLLCEKFPAYRSYRYKKWIRGKVHNGVERARSVFNGTT